jgi:aminopeptidase
VSADSLERLADLAVGLGANIQPGQVVSIGADVGQQDVARAIAEAAYQRGARFVDVRYFDPHVKRSRIEHAAADTLEYVPPWYGERVLALGRERGASIALAGPSAPGVLDGLDPARVGRDQLPFLKETLQVINQRLINWTVVPCPTLTWARLVHPELDDATALARLWMEISRVCRLDEPDPDAAWKARVERLSGLASVLNQETASLETVDGVSHLANVPTEEVYATPDPERAEGYVRSTRPLLLFDGTVIRGLEVRFEGGRAVEITADQGGEVLRGRAAIDEGASRLGEIALVDNESRVGQLGTVFYETLLDENAVSHIALGGGDQMSVEDADRGRVNLSAIHIDFMIGGAEVAATGIGVDGSEVPLLRDGAWQV